MIDLTKLTTKRLLALKRKRYPSSSLPVSMEYWPCTCDECAENMKLAVKYKEEYDLVKQELARREHIDDR